MAVVKRTHINKTPLQYNILLSRALERGRVLCSTQKVERGNSTHPSFAYFGHHCVRTSATCGLTLPWRMSVRATEISSCAFSCIDFAPVALERSSHVARDDLLQEFLPQASQFFHLLKFSAFLVLGHCLCSHNHYENN